MKPTSGWQSYWRVVLIALIITTFHAQTFAWQAPAVAPATAPATAPAALTANEREAMTLVKKDTITDITTVLSGSEMQGRGTASPGGEKAAHYLAERFAKLGLKPLGDSGSYLQ